MGAKGKGLMGEGSEAKVGENGEVETEREDGESTQLRQVGR